MPVTVVVRSGSAGRENQTAASLSITFDAPVIVIGRGDASEVRLPDPSVSHRHATVRQRGSDYILIDEGSTNGTFMGGVKLGAHAPRLLKHRDIARVGRVWLEFRFDAVLAPPQTVMATKELALSLVARALEAQGQTAGPRISIIEGPDRGRVLLLDDGGRAYVIGRGTEADLQLEDVDASRRHVQLVRRTDQLLVRDLGSKNGAHLAGHPLEERDLPWKAGEELRVGQNVLVYQFGAIDALAELERAADEKIGPDEPLAPPDIENAPPEERDRKSERRLSVPAPVSLVEVGAEGAAPIAEVPQAKPRSPPSGTSQGRTRTKAGWTSTDFVVVLLAVLVLALSIAGLVWLLRG
jgi:pSer/pThr/pTyr-binding forkhead associated (FHA) protein